ncbi:MAG: hypothetical protein JWP01_580 [Myxococcales bacterium]|nr:hypothetical protein [Myxococcales bacterium]
MNRRDFVVRTSFTLLSACCPSATICVVPTLVTRPVRFRMHRLTLLLAFSTVVFGFACGAPKPTGCQPQLGGGGCPQNSAAQPPTLAPKSSPGACSRQTSVARLMFQCAPGAIGSIAMDGNSSSGWLVWDTGATYSLMRTTTRESPAGSPASAAVTMGDWTGTVVAAPSGKLWSMKAPSEGQVATVGTDLLKTLAVRISTGSRTLYVSDDEHACSADQLRSEGFRRLD